MGHSHLSYSPSPSTPPPPPPPPPPFSPANRRTHARRNRAHVQNTHTRQSNIILLTDFTVKVSQMFPGSSGRKDGLHPIRLPLRMRSPPKPGVGWSGNKLVIDFANQELQELLENDKCMQKREPRWARSRRWVMILLHTFHIFSRCVTLSGYHERFITSRLPHRYLHVRS